MSVTCSADSADESLRTSTITRTGPPPAGTVGKKVCGQSTINEVGPFETVEEARADMLATDEEGDAEPAESLQEAEDEIGIAVSVGIRHDKHFILYTIRPFHHAPILCG